MCTLCTDTFKASHKLPRASTGFSSLTSKPAEISETADGTDLQCQKAHQFAREHLGVSTNQQKEYY